MATMTLSPTSAAPGTAITVTGSGFANNAKTKVAVESVPILTFKASNNGSFTKTIYAPSGANRNVVIVATCYIGHSWVVVATATLAIVNVGPPVDTTKPTITSGPTVGSITQTSATIAWSLSESANGQIEFGLTEGPPYGSVSTKENGYLPSHSQNLSGLTAGRTYYYRVHSVDAAGNGVYSAANATFQTAAADPVYTPPSAPASLTATAGNNLVDLAWTAPASNGGTAITNYRVYRNAASIFLGNVLTYQNTGLVNNQLYSYQVTAINAAGLEGPPSVSRSATPGDTTPPTVSDIAHSNVTPTTASVSWSINEPATGQVQYGLTAAYDLTTTLEPSLLLGHAQELTGLTPGMVYHYRAKSLDEAGNPGYSNDRTFETVWVAPPLPVFYGPGVGYETKANERLDGGKQSYRFRASQTSNAVSVAVNVRTGDGYSLGTGGTVKASIRSDSGGVPSGTILGSVTWSPGNPGTAESKAHRTFMSSIPLVAGTVYHLVTENTHPSPAANYVSVNVVLAWNPADTPRQPAFSDDFAVHRNTGGSWSLQNGYLAVFDLLYANGQHDGNMYFAVITGQEGYISGTSNMVRARFTVSGGTRTVSGAFVQVRRNSGTGALVVRLEQSDGTLIESVSVAASGIAIVGATDVQSPVAWTAVPFVSNRTLTNGQTYNLRLSCAAGTQYSVMPLRWSDSDMAAWNGYHFRDGAGDNGSSGQETTNGGSSWADLYGDAPSDFGLYFGVV